MRLRVIETILLAAIILLIGGCDSSCLDFDLQLSEFLGLSHYVICSQDPITNQYQPQKISIHIPGFTSDETYAPPSAFDCGTSTDGQAPLPHMKSAAAVPSSSAAGGTAARNTAQASTPHNNASSTANAALYKQWGFNSGIIPPGLINPNIPVPIVGTPSITSASCSPSSPDVLFVNHLHATATRIGTCPFSTKATIGLVSRPLQVAVTPDGTQALITNFDNAISFVNLATNTVAFTLNTNQSINPAGIAITPDGKRAYVTSFNNIDPSLLVIDIASRTTVAHIPTGDWPQSVYITPDGTQAWIGFPFQDEVDVFDTLTNTRSASLHVTFPTGMAFNPTGTRAYIGSKGSGILVAFDTATFKAIKSYAVGNYPVDVFVLPQGRYVLVNNFGSATQSLIDTVTGNVVSTKPDNNESSTLGLVPLQ